MTTIPKISIIIPVYNVEKYLRQCLDSVVNQTMRDIQIICVNDGSPDGSRAILQEYANRDSRIEIIDKPNGGLSSARNAAYPSIKGKYTLFVDSDDWIELDLCEKTYRKAETTGAQMTAFAFQRGRRTVLLLSPADKTTVKEKLPILDSPSVCNKLWRTDFLLNNKLYFPEGLICEDFFVTWLAITLADRISIVLEQLYHYRFRHGSISQTGGERLMDIVSIFDKIRTYLFESGYYTDYQDEFISQKLRVFHEHYVHLPTSLKPKFAIRIRESLTTDDREFYRTAPKELVSKTVKLFYQMIDGGPMAAMNYHVSPVVRSIIGMPERLFRHWVIKPIKQLAVFR